MMIAMGEESSESELNLSLEKTKEFITLDGKETNLKNVWKVIGEINSLASKAEDMMIPKSKPMDDMNSSLTRIQPRILEGIKPIAPIVCVRDLKEILVQIESENCNENECKLVGHDLEDLKKDYNNWELIFNNTAKKIVPELTMWRQGEKLLRKQIEKSEANRSPSEMYLRAAVRIRILPEDNFQCFTLPRATVFIQSKINFLKETLYKVLNDWTFVGVQCEKIYLIEKCLERKARLLKDKEKNSIKENGKSDTEFENIMLNVKTDDAGFSQIKNDIVTQLKKITSRRAREEINETFTEDLRTEVDDLLEKFSSDRIIDKPKSAINYDALSLTGSDLTDTDTSGILNSDVDLTPIDNTEIDTLKLEVNAFLENILDKIKIERDNWKVKFDVKNKDRILKGQIKRRYLKRNNLELERNDYLVIKNSGMAWYLSLKDVHLPEINSKIKPEENHETPANSPKKVHELKSNTSFENSEKDYSVNNLSDTAIDSTIIPEPNQETKIDDNLVCEAKSQFVDRALSELLRLLPDEKMPGGTDTQNTFGANKEKPELSEMSFWWETDKYESTSSEALKDISIKSEAGATEEEQPNDVENVLQEGQTDFLKNHTNLENDKESTLVNSSINTCDSDASVPNDSTDMLSSKKEKEKQEDSFEVMFKLMDNLKLC